MRHGFQSLDPMKDFFICDCVQHENKIITSSFVVVSKQVKPKKSGDPYLALTLGDRAGQIEAKMWDNVEDAIDGFEQDDFVKIKGLINKYKNRFQITIKTLEDFVDGFQDGNLKGLVQAFMADPKIAEAYRNAPAAKTLHHAYIGGLLDHVVSLFRSCDLVCRNYPQINRDLLLTGAFLHDIGKIHELTYNRSFSYTTRGQLLGHMIIELEMLQEKLAQFPAFPDEMKTLVEHLIISHHGQYDFGSPKLPMFPEALTAYNPSLGRPLLNSKKFLEKKTVDRAVSSTVKSEATDVQTEAPSSVTVSGDGMNPAPLATAAYSDKA